jgi:hypothetical protein
MMGRNLTRLAGDLYHASLERGIFLNVRSRFSLGGGHDDSSRFPQVHRGHRRRNGPRASRARHGRAEPSLAEEPAPPAERAAAPLNILILGGTGFTGPEQVEYAIARGHRVTLSIAERLGPGCSRGKSPKS